MAHEAGKGSRPRPFSISQAEYDSKWDAIFGRKLNKEQQEFHDQVIMKEEYYDVMELDDARAEDEAFKEIEIRSNSLTQDNKTV